MAQIVRLCCVLFFFSWFGVALNKSSMLKEYLRTNYHVPTQQPLEDHAMIELSENHDYFVHLNCTISGCTPVSSRQHTYRHKDEQVSQPTHLNIISPPPELFS